MLNAVISDHARENEKIFSLGMTCPHCDMYFSTVDEAVAHDAACPNHPASISAERLEKEADWLANRLVCIQSQGDIEPETRDRSTEEWRVTARKAVELE